MLAPMQGLTNRALRAVFINRVRPDVVFTEYVRVQSSNRKCISSTDRREIADDCQTTPLVVQLIGSNIDYLVAAAETVQELGAQHLNINLGCPYGRMTKNTAGGSLLKYPAGLPLMLESLRKIITGSFSVKIRSGYDDPSQLLSLIPMFEDCGIDFLIVHPRTVVQRFSGLADHAVTAAVVRKTSLPVIANGDIYSAADGDRVSQTGAAGLMLGRGAIADPLLFERLRGNYPATSSMEKRGSELREYLQELLVRYQGLFCGDQQILSKMKDVLGYVNDPCFSEQLRTLRRTKRLAEFSELLAAFSWVSSEIN
ncbi:MAG: tRNA-dihydrouridine synthase family protein [Proteobacteria bacterium]|nr:tRNA-dihydrouridine synthase family protein [Pseudomonadota bacterium]MBU1710614.1 tRNA-dihydrouridine synthase family protein [Pseudomonadota bacterium]